ncbi:uncharacterized protein SOCG_04282 [Schizosaccharomyces octosporus yFS286]|uniref:Uncharacterized protein n=1 Tax=Schizosaccharomyces octosporus (strain yFS286) TaxID=483514 RepID=S9R987_SCHOY|nr:uncharacterized protein SOCG_04282 [Schizosaccharomyces octosporus yFS286]EPX70674.1 hypothetical protein SOCG_04282 [Schizosaccharomyces octosporus yFS286]
MEKSASSLNAGFAEIQKLLSLVQKQTNQELTQVYKKCEGQESLLLDLANGIQAYFSIIDTQQRKLEAVYETQLLILEENNHASKSFESYKNDVRLSKSRIEQVLDKIVDFLSWPSFSDNRTATSDSDELLQEQSLDSSSETQRGQTSETHDLGYRRQQDNEETSSAECNSQESSPFKQNLRVTSPVQETIPFHDNVSLYRIPQRGFQSINFFHLNDSPKQKSDGPTGNVCLFPSTDNGDNTREFSSFFKSDDPNPFSSSKKVMKNDEYVHKSTPKIKQHDITTLSSDNSINLSSNFDLSKNKIREREVNANEGLTKKQQVQGIQTKNPEPKNLVYEKSPKLEQTVNYARLARSVSFLSLKDKKNKESKKKKKPLENNNYGNSNRISGYIGTNNYDEGFLSPSRDYKMHSSTMKPSQKLIAIDKENQRVRNPKVRNSVSKTSNKFLHANDNIKCCFTNENPHDHNEDDKIKESTINLSRGQVNSSPQQSYPANANNRKHMFTLDFNDWHT